MAPSGPWTFISLSAGNAGSSTFQARLAAVSCARAAAIGKVVGSDGLSAAASRRIAAISGSRSMLLSLLIVRLRRRSDHDRLGSARLAGVRANTAILVVPTLAAAACLTAKTLRSSAMPLGRTARPSPRAACTHAV